MEAEDGVVKSGTDDLEELIVSKQPMHLIGPIGFLREQSIDQLPILHYAVLRKYYGYYPELQFKNLKEFEAAGGVAHVYDYYQKRSEQFGFDSEVTKCYES